MNRKTELLSTAPIPKALLAMGIPTMAGMLINSLYSLADGYFAGNLGERQMGAISVVFPLGQLITGIGLMFGNGAGSYISRLLGKSETAAADKAASAASTASTALYSSLTVGAVFILVSVIFLKPILTILGASESIMPYALGYARIYIVSCICSLFNVTVNSIITSEGAAGTAMSAMLTGAILNIILDPVFIYKFDSGVAGAAIATAISQAASSLIYLMYISKGKSNFGFRIKDCRLCREIYSQIMKIGVPVFTFQLLTSLSISLTNRAIKDYGDSAVAGMGAVTRIVSMGTLTVFGFIKGFQPIAGFSFGAKKFDRLNNAIKTSVIWSTAFCILAGLIFALFPARIISCFTKDDIVMIETGAKALRANGISCMFFGFHTVYSSLFLALGKGKEGFFLGACRQGICFIPIIFILPYFWGISGILFAQPLADILTFIVTIIMAASLNKKLKILNEKNAVQG